jgi:Skp family chaperone for outer membrane proteins
MKSLNAISMTLIVAATTTLAAPPRFASVRVRDLYSARPSTTSLQEEVKKQRDEIMKDQRAEKLRNIIAELQTLQAQLSDKNKPLDEGTGKALARKYQLKRQEALTLQRDFEGYQKEKEKEINVKMVTAMRTSLNLIVEVSGQLAKERGFDSVFDSSGNTNTGVPFILYSKGSPDLTEDVQAALQDRETAKESEKKKASAK